MEILKRVSIRAVIESFFNTVKRFTLPVIFSIITSILIIVLIENQENKPSPLITKSIFVSILGFFFTLVSTLYIERSEKAGKIKYLFQIIMLTLIAYLFFTLPSNFRQNDYVTFSVFLAAAVFALMFVYIKKDDDESGFGIYNINLFMRGFTSFVFAVVLFLGTASALFAVQELFLNNNFHEELYGDAWVICAVFFAPLYFLSGLPGRSFSSEESFTYPKPLKVLLQFIIVPLIALYLIILYSYTVKILITQNWPEGIVSYMIISFSLVGISSVILLSPLKDSEQFNWINSFSKYFFMALVPLIIVLFMAITERVSQYGITEKRYFIFLLSFWLAGITVYMIFSKTKDLKMLPVTLCIISVLSLFGPWSCFSISKSSQLSILEGLLTKNGILLNGEIVQSDKIISFADRKSISSIISYFYDSHGIAAVNYLKTTYQKLAAENKDYKNSKPEYAFYRDEDEAVPRRALVKDGLGFDFINEWQNESSSDQLNLAVKYFHDPAVENISEYDSYIDCRDNLIKARVLDSLSNVYIKYDSDNFMITFEKENNTTIDSIDLKLLTGKIIAGNIYNNGKDQIEPSEMKVSNETDKMKYLILFRNLSAKRDNEKDPYKLTSAYFGLYYKIK
ncbi:MAG TPA: DUF4153 domain-containing protein [Clostridiales bacterium]|nr:DUF4153 domain-containing protein [Clostridiales bacterium]HQP69887.1 DUF4153 domain-containing protein [Clostridiales bacterium]